MADNLMSYHVKRCHIAVPTPPLGARVECEHGHPITNLTRDHDGPQPQKERKQLSTTTVKLRSGVSLRHIPDG